MAKGQAAKDYVAKKLSEVFGEDYIGEVDKKYYVWSWENGEKVQVAIAMTCPKNPVGTVMVSKSNGLDFENMTEVPVTTGFKPAEISSEETENIKALIEKLGL